MDGNANEFSVDKFLNWFEFKLSEHKIYKQKTQKLLEMQDIAPKSLSVIPEMESVCETETKFIEQLKEC